MNQFFFLFKGAFFMGTRNLLLKNSEIISAYYLTMHGIRLASRIGFLKKEILDQLDQFV